jgi:hypothetical protein
VEKGGGAGRGGGGAVVVVDVVVFALRLPRLRPLQVEGGPLLGRPVVPDELFTPPCPSVWLRPSARPTCCPCGVAAPLLFLLHLLKLPL